MDAALHCTALLVGKVYYVFLEPLYIDNGALLSNRADDDGDDDDDSFPPTHPPTHPPVENTECSLLPNNEDKQKNRFLFGRGLLFLFIF